MVKQLRLVALLSCVFISSAFGMGTLKKWLGSDSSQQIQQPLPIVSYLEDTKKLSSGSSALKDFIDNDLDAGQAYDFFCGAVIKRQPQLMEERFGQLISGMGCLGIGKVVNFATSRLKLNKFMTEGMINEQAAVTAIFAQVCGRKKESILQPLQEKLENELPSEESQRKIVLYGIGRVATGKLLQCIHEHMTEIPQIIIKEMVEKKSTDQSLKKEEQLGVVEDKKKKESSGPTYTFLAKIVRSILEKCTKDAEEWKHWFGEATVKAYENK